MGRRGRAISLIAPLSALCQFLLCAFLFGKINENVVLKMFVQKFGQKSVGTKFGLENGIFFSNYF